MVIRVSLQAAGTAGDFRLEVSDDGRGFDPDRTHRGGFGLQTMQQRAAELAGTFTVKSSPGEGTRILVVFAVVNS